MTVSEKLVTVYQCDRCGHEWIPRNALDRDTDDLPTVCPKCKSPYWNRPRQNLTRSPANPPKRKLAKKR